MIVGGGVPDAPQGSSLSRVTCRAASPLAAVAVCDGGKLRAGHARPLQMAGELAAMSVGGEPYSGKTKKRDGHCPVSFFLKRRRKTERLAGA